MDLFSPALIRCVWRLFGATQLCAPLSLCVWMGRLESALFGATVHTRGSDYVVRSVRTVAVELLHRPWPSIPCR